MKPKKASSTTAPANTFTFDLDGAKPSISEYGNTIREANQSDFPVLAGNGVSFFTITMKPGALRVPHWHPNAWELDLLRARHGQILDRHPRQRETSRRC
jgi:oxalate decarboxylase